MTKNILVLLFTVLSVSYFPIKADKINADATYKKLVSLHKHNALTIKNVDFLLDRSYGESYFHLFSILHDKTVSIQKSIDQIEFTQALRHPLSIIGQNTALLVAGLPSGAAMAAAMSWLISRYPYCSTQRLQETSFFPNGSTTIIIQTKVNSPNTNIMLAGQLFIGGICLIAGAAASYEGASNLYQYFAGVATYKAEIKRIDDIIAQLRTLKASTQ